MAFTQTVAATPPYDAVIFDMDGVVTDTASLHATAWKHLFDSLLMDPQLPQAAVEFPDVLDSSPFTIGGDYRAYVDGRPREDGVREFLASRGIVLPEGTEADGPDVLTVHGQARKKNDAFNETLEESGVTVFPGTISLIRRLRAGGRKIGLVTSSRNAPVLLKYAQIEDLFDTVVDGQTAAEQGLPGKPKPDTFLAAAHHLGVTPDKAVVVEDAIAGVQAGVAGSFGLVVGVDRHGHRDELAAAGADIVVGDLHELDLGEERKLPRTLVYVGGEDLHKGKRAALTTLANGYMSLRGTASEIPTAQRGAPGVYIAGIFNRLVSDVEGRVQEHESMVNLAHWAHADVRFADGDWLSEGGLQVVKERRSMNFDDGVLVREILLEDPLAGPARRIRMMQRRLVSMDKQHLGAVLTRITLLSDQPQQIMVRTGIDARVNNDNVAEYDQLEKQHLETRMATSREDGTLMVEVYTKQSRLRVGMAQRTSVVGHRDGVVFEPETPIQAECVEIPNGHGKAVFSEYSLSVSPDVSYDFDSVTAVVHSRDAALSSVRGGAVQQLDWLPNASFAGLLHGHRAALNKLWDRFGVDVETTAGHPQQTQLELDLHTFHLMGSMSPHTAYQDVGTTARGMTGEGYRGHVFWDEVFVLPLLNMRLPEISKALLMYRWRRLDAARALASESGFSGAQFPWQSGSDGREETPAELFNHRSNRWMADNSRRQYHVGLAIAYNAWQHYRVTADTKWLAEQGGELIIEIVRLFASMADYDAAEDRFHIRHVMGPDEYHDGKPGTPGSGVDDNAYTNVMVAWLCRHAVRIFDVISSHEAEELTFRLGIDPEEITRWKHMAARLFVPFSADGRISQFAGYEDLKELDWQAYRTKYGNIGRMDLIMESENDSTNNYKLSKQADVNMLFFLLGPVGVKRELRRMGYELTDAQVEDTIDYYVSRSTDGSSLSRVANAGVLAMINRPEAWDHWQQALRIDIDDTQWGSTSEGIHLGAMAGTVDVVIRAFAGVLIRYNRIEFYPNLPKQMKSAHFRVLFQGQVIEVHVTHTDIELLSRSRETHSVHVYIANTLYRLEGGARLRVKL